MNDAERKRMEEQTQQIRERREREPWSPKQQVAAQAAKGSVLGGQQTPPAQPGPWNDLPGMPVCGRCAGSAIEQALGDPSQWRTDRPQATVGPQTDLDGVVKQLLQGAGGEPALPPAHGLPPALRAMQDELLPQHWQEVLQARAMLLVREEARERERAKTAASSAGQPFHFPRPGSQELEQHRQRLGLTPVEQAQAAKEQAEKQAVQQQIERRLAGLGGEEVMGYRLMGQTDTQRFYKREPETGQVEVQAKPASEMDLALQGLRMVSENLDTLVSALEGRLERVLEDPQVGAAQAGSEPSSPSSSAELTHRMRSHEAFLRHAVLERLQSILDRLVL